MEQTISVGGRRAGWSDDEDKLLWETADAAQQQGKPLKNVFEQIARQTGRRPNSIRNYYYAQVRQREDVEKHPARFVPFSQEEIDWLMEQVLVARAAGQSVRSCLQKLAAGDHSLMLRYQNKYRSVLKGRPGYVQAMVDRLNGQGVLCDAPVVNHRVRADLAAECDALVGESRRFGDAELARACGTIVEYLRGMRAPNGEVLAAAREMVAPLKEFLAREEGERDAGALYEILAEKLGILEGLVE